MAQTILQAPFKGEKAMFVASDDNALIKQITTTHAPDGREIDVKAIFQIVEDILNSVTSTIKSDEVKEPLGEKPNADVANLLEALAYIINRLSCEISYKSMSGVDGHSTTVSLFNMLSSYSWDAKLVLTLAAFALNYGEFWLLAHIFTTNRLASKMAILKQLPNIMESSGQLKPRYEALNNLIQCILELTECILCFRELPSNYVSKDHPAFSAAITAIPTAIYWIIRSVIACASNITYLSAMGHEYTISTSELWELSSLTHKIKNINDFLQKQLTSCRQHMEEKKHVEAYETLVHTFETAHLDNMRVLKPLIHPKDDERPLFDGYSKIKAHLEVLRRKTVLLLISGLDISPDELAILEQIYIESRMQAGRIESEFEIVWIPVVERTTPWSESTQMTFEDIRSNLPWYSVWNPSLIDQAVIRFIKENLNFNKKAILVVLDPLGKIVSPNAFHMMWIWGSVAFPFTSSREEALWREETWRLELVVDGIDPMLLDWMRERKFIILYGADDIDWIRKFTRTAREVANSARIPLEMIYVGKRSKREQVRKITNVIEAERLSHTWNDPAMIWFFWTRLECMLFSKIELQSVDERDLIMQETKKLLSYDKTGSWALLSKGSNVTLSGYGNAVLSTLYEYDAWKENAEKMGFDYAIKQYYDRLHETDHPCCLFEFESNVGRTPETMTCPECRRNMEKFVTFSCCHD